MVSSEPHGEPLSAMSKWLIACGKQFKEEEESKMFWTKIEQCTAFDFKKNEFTLTLGNNEFLARILSPAVRTATNLT